MFTAALFIIVMMWKQLRCTLMNECLKKMWCVCVCMCVCTHMECYSDLKRIEILPFVTTEMERGHHAKWNKLTRTKAMFSPLYVISQKKKQTNPQFKLIDTENRLVVARSLVWWGVGKMSRDWKVQASSDYT